MTQDTTQERQTPRTSAVMRKGSGTYQEMFEHACDLERELAQARAECERLKDALEPIRIAGDASGPEFRKMFEDAAKRPEYWTELCELRGADLDAANARIETLEGLLRKSEQFIIGMELLTGTVTHSGSDISSKEFVAQIRAALNREGTK